MVAYVVNYRFLKLLRQNWILLLLWCIGLLSGILTASYFCTDLLLWRSSLLLSKQSVWWLFHTCGVLPFGVTVVALRYNFKYIIHILGLFKSFGFGYVHYIVYNAFGHAGWLMRPILLFSDLFLVILLLHFWIQYLNSTGRWLKKQFLNYLLLSLFVCYIDSILVAPFALRLV